MHVSVSQHVWFIDSSAAGSTNVGTEAIPHTRIASFNAAQGTAAGPHAGDTVHLRGGTGTYTEADGIHLLNGQALVGGGEDLVVGNRAASTGSTGGAVGLEGVSGTFTVTGATTMGGVQDDSVVAKGDTGLAVSLQGGVSVTMTSGTAIAFTNNDAASSLAIGGGLRSSPPAAPASTPTAVAGRWR